MLHLVFFLVLAIIALQFTDGIMSYGVLSNDIGQASKVLQWAAGKVGLAPALITTKVVIVAVFIALYALTTLPFWLYLAAIAYYLYRTGKGAVIWRNIIKSKAVTTVVADVESKA